MNNVLKTLLENLVMFTVVVMTIMPGIAIAEDINPTSTPSNAYNNISPTYNINNETINNLSSETINNLNSETINNLSSETINNLNNEIINDLSKESVPINKEETLGPYQGDHKYYIHIFNVDDVARASVNGRQIARIDFMQDSGWIDITDYLIDGSNKIRLTDENGIYGGWTYGFEIRQDDSKIIWRDSCGTVGTYGCMNDDQTRGPVYYNMITLVIKSTLTHSLTVKKVWTMDGNNKDKTIFFPGDVIHYGVIVENGGSSTVKATFDFLASGPKKIYSWTGQGDVPPGFPMYYSPSTIPTDAPAGTYNIMVTVTYNGKTSFKQVQFAIVAKSTTGIGEISGTVFDDFNGNGKKDTLSYKEGEPGLSDWNIILSVWSQNVMKTFKTTKTDTNGNYVFKDIPAGRYYVGEITNEGWKRTVPSDSAFLGKYEIDIPENRKTKITEKNFGNNLIKKARYPNTFYAGIGWSSKATDVSQQAWALDASLRKSYVDTGPYQHNGVLGMYDVYVAYHNICTRKNYICNPEGNGNYKVAFGHSGGTQTLMDKLETGAIKVDYAVFIAPALINQTQVDNLVKSGKVKKKVIIIESTLDSLYNFQARFERSHRFKPMIAIPAVTLLNKPPGDIWLNLGLDFLITTQPVDRFLSTNNIKPSWLPKDETFWVGGADRSKRTQFKKSANVIVVNMDSEFKNVKSSWDVHHGLLVKTIERFQNGIPPFDIYGLKRV